MLKNFLKIILKFKVFFISSSLNAIWLILLPRDDWQSALGQVKLRSSFGFAK